MKFVVEVEVENEENMKVIETYMLISLESYHFQVYIRRIITRVFSIKNVVEQLFHSIHWSMHQQKLNELNNKNNRFKYEKIEEMEKLLKKK